MRKRWGIAVVACCAVAAMIVALARSRKKEPEYAGKRLSEWLAMLEPPECIVPPGREEAQRAVQQIGTNALPYLIQAIAIDYGNPSAADKLWRALYKPAFWAFKVPWLESTSAFIMNKSDAKLRSANNAIYGFGELGPRAAPAIPELVRIIGMTNNYAASRARTALVLIGNDSIPPLAEILKQKHHPGRAGAASAILGLCRSPNVCSNACWALPMVIQVIKEEDDSDAFTTATELEFLNAELDLCLPDLFRWLQDTNADVRCRAVFCLGCYRAQVRPALPRILEALNDSDADVREAATNAVRKIAPEALSGSAATQQ